MHPASDRQVGEGIQHVDPGHGTVEVGSALSFPSTVVGTLTIHVRLDQLLAN